MRARSERARCPAGSVFILLVFFLLLVLQGVQQADGGGVAGAGVPGRGDPAGSLDGQRGASQVDGLPCLAAAFPGPGRPDPPGGPAADGDEPGPGLAVGPRPRPPVVALGDD